MKQILCAWLIIFNTAGCSQLLDDGSLLPPSTGEPGEIILVMDSTKWKGSLGEELRTTFRALLPGVLQDEPLFRVIYIDPTKFNRILKHGKNLLFVHTFEGNSRGDELLENYFTTESLQRIEEDPELFSFKQKDLFAKDQSVLYLFQVTNDKLISHIQANRDQLRDYFLEVEKQRFYRALYKAPSVKGIENTLTDNHQCYLKIPYGYEVAVETDNAMWIRQMDRKIDKNIFVTYANYNTENAFNLKNIVRFRDRKWRRFLLGSDSLSYMITEPLVPVDSSAISLRKKFAVETRGIWKLNNNTMGGSFLSYTFVDPQLNRLYYIEGFVYAPGEKKSNPLRELETILMTFKTASELEAS